MSVKRGPTIDITNPLDETIMDMESIQFKSFSPTQQNFYSPIGQNRAGLNLADLKRDKMKKGLKNRQLTLN